MAKPNQHLNVKLICSNSRPLLQAYIRNIYIDALRVIFFSIEMLIYKWRIII